MPPSVVTAQTTVPALSTTHVVLGMISSALSAGVSMHWYYKNAWGSKLKYKLNMWNITRELKKCEKKANKREETKILEWTRMTLKLHSPSAMEQALAIGQLYYACDKRAYDVLMQRLVSSPPIEREAVGILLSTLRELAPPASLELTNSTPVIRGT